VDGFPIQYFPSLTIPCPAVGEVVHVSFTYKHPQAAGEDTISVRRSIAVSHDGAEPRFRVSLKDSRICLAPKTLIRPILLS